MRVVISADMEGATGVTCPEDCAPGNPRWERLRHLFTGDVNAVALGFLDSGVEDVLVNEAHSSMRNLLLEELDPRVRMLTGRHKPLGMVQGVQGSDLIAFVGYHSAPSTPGVLSHTFLGCEITDVTLGGRTMSEGYLNAMVAAELGVKVALVSGDDLTCEDARDYAPGARCVEVKEAIDRYSAVCRTPADTAEELRRAAGESLSSATVPRLPEPPYVCRVEFLGTSSAAAAAQVPTVELRSPRVVEFQAATMQAVYRCFNVVATMASVAAEPTYG